MSYTKIDQIIENIIGENVSFTTGILTSMMSFSAGGRHFSVSKIALKEFFDGNQTEVILLADKSDDGLKVVKFTKTRGKVTIRNVTNGSNHLLDTLTTSQMNSLVALLDKYNPESTH